MSAIGLAKSVPTSAFLAAAILVINVLQSASVIIRPFSKTAFRKFNGKCAEVYWQMLVHSAEDIQGIQVIFSGDEIPADENAILLPNHQGLADVLFVLILASRKGRLKDLKWFAKDIIKFVPGIGWGLYFLDSIFLKRNWARDRNSIEATFENIKTNQIPIWLVSFLEGTRRTSEKLAQSQAYAEKKGMTPLKHLLLPRTKGFVASVIGLREHVDAVYDITLGYKAQYLPLGRLFTGDPLTVNIHVRRFEIQTLPSSEDALTQWTLNLFREKDRLLELFYQTNQFPSSV